MNLTQSPLTVKKGSIIDAVVFTPDVAMCYVFFITKSSTIKGGKVVPGLYAEFVPDAPLAAVLKNHSRQQTEITHIMTGRIQQLAPTLKGGRIQRLDVSSLLEDKGANRQRISRENISEYRLLMKISELKPEIHALIYWPPR